MGRTKFTILCAVFLYLGGVALGASKFCVTPYLQRPATDAMTLIFFTDSACTATTTCTLKNGAAAKTLMTTNTVGVWAQALTNNVNCRESSEWNNSLYRHRVRLEGLKPNRIYDYTVKLDNGGATYSNTFRTAPDRDTPIRFVSYADCETEKNPWANYVANLKRMKDRQPDFFALSGDYAARGGRQEHWDGFWKANAGTETDVAGSIPILAVIGNHDLFDQGLSGHTGGYYYDMQGEPSTERYLTYFESTSNGVDYAYRDGVVDAQGRKIPETRDMSQLFHREDYGPVTLIFLDTNNGQDGDADADHDKDTNYLNKDDGQHLKGGLDRRKGARHPDFNAGSPQYTWLTNQLADAQQRSRFTFVFNHHCPYSRGAHNRDWRQGEDGSALALRALTATMVRYGVDGWYCGHDELLEHSITNGYEILPNGQRRKHTLSIYDLGCSGDSPRSSNVCTNPLEYWWSSSNYGGTGSYGFLETDVTTNKNGQWTCTITPIQGSTGNPLSAQIVYVENPDRGESENDLVYAQASNSSNPIDGATHTKPSGWLAWEKPPEGPAWDESVEVELSEVTAADLTYDGIVQTPNLTVKAGDLVVPDDHYTVSTSPSPVKNAGSYSVTVTGAGNVRGTKTISFKVVPAQVTVTADPASKEFGAANPQFDATVTGLQGDDTKSCLAYSFTCAADESTPAGSSVDIVPTGAVEQGNYVVEYVPGKLMVTKPQPRPSETTTVTASITYGQMLSAADGSVSGTMTNGTTFSGSVVLVEPEADDPKGWASLPVFKTSSKDVFAAVASILKDDSATTADGRRTRRCVHAPDWCAAFWRHTEKSGSFEKQLGLFGSYYDKSEDLGGCCSEDYETTNLKFLVNGAPIADIVVGASTVKVDATKENLHDVKVSFTRSTGLVSGSYKNSENRRISYKGIVINGWGEGCGCDRGGDPVDPDVFLPFMNGTSTTKNSFDSVTMDVTEK